MGERFNRFTDMVDLDRLAAQEYSPEVIVAISESLAGMQQSNPALPLTMDMAQDILAQSRTGAVGIPRLIQVVMRSKDSCSVNDPAAVGQTVWGEEEDFMREGKVNV